MAKYTTEKGLELELDTLHHEGIAYLSFDEIIKWLKWEQSLLEEDDQELMHNLIKEMVKCKQQSKKVYKKCEKCGGEGWIYMPKGRVRKCNKC